MEKDLNISLNKENDDSKTVVSIIGEYEQKKDEGINEIIDQESTKEGYECKEYDNNELQQKLAKAILEIMNYNDFIGSGEYLSVEIEKFPTTESKASGLRGEAPMCQTLPKVEDDSSSDSGDEGGLWFTARITYEDDDFNKPGLTRNLGKEGTPDYHQRQVSLSYKPEIIEDILSNENDISRGHSKDRKKNKKRNLKYQLQKGMNPEKILQQIKHQQVV